MIDYKLKVTHDEDDTLIFSPTRKNGKAYPREENNLGDDSSMFIPDDGNFCDTIIAKNKDLSSNNILERIDSVLSSVYIDGTK